ncbi:MAG: hypothetical protein IE927_04545 [Rhodobacterales bacterium]|nr:hypothetical protein [Rhodobacterales bacterium]
MTRRDFRRLFAAVSLASPLPARAIAAPAPRPAKGPTLTARAATLAARLRPAQGLPAR